MKEDLYKKMESMFHLVEHHYRDIGPVELMLSQLARGNTFNMRVLGIDGIKRFRRSHPDCALTFKPNHLSEADFIFLSLLFRENGLQVVTEGGANLFIDDLDVFRDLLPRFVDPRFEKTFNDSHMSLAQYLARGAFKVFREPITLAGPDGEKLQLGRKDILSLTRAYRRHLVKSKEMYVTFPGYSTVKSGFFEFLKKDRIKTGRSYTGKTDGFHHLPFQMDLEASLATGVEIYFVDVNIAYAPVLEDINFAEIQHLQSKGMSADEIYREDLGFIIQEICRSKRKGEMSIKFSDPYSPETTALKDGLMGRKIKRAAQNMAQKSFENVLAMQPLFPANIYFASFDTDFERMPIPRLREKIDRLRDYLGNLLWGRSARRVDLHYVRDYNGRIYCADEIINRTFDLFAVPGRQITARDGDEFVVYNKSVAKQYRNHIAHFIKDLEIGK